MKAERKFLARLLEQDEEVEPVIADLLRATRRRARAKNVDRKIGVPPDWFTWVLTSQLTAYASTLRSKAKTGRQGATRRKDLAKTIEDVASKIEDNDRDFQLSVFWNLADVLVLRPAPPIAQTENEAKGDEVYGEEIGEIGNPAGRGAVVLAGKRQDLYDFGRLPAILRRYAARLRKPLGAAIRQRYRHAETRLAEVAVVRTIRESTGEPHFQKAAWLLHAASMMAGRARPWKREGAADKKAARALETCWSRYLKNVRPSP